MTKKQAHILMALGVAIILTQLLCTAVLLRAQERTRKEAEAARVSAMGTLEMQKQQQSAVVATSTVDMATGNRPSTDTAPNVWAGAQPLADAVTPTPPSGSYTALCEAYEKAGQARVQKQHELESIERIEKDLERQIIKFQQTHVSEPPE